MRTAEKRRHRRPGPVGGTLRGLPLLLWWALAGAGGCAEPDRASPRDGAMAADAHSPDPGLADPPEIPWLEEGQPPIAPPRLTPCPRGWREVTGAGRVTTCDPYPEAGARGCGPGEAHFSGEPGCAPVGSDCPPGEFSDHLPADRPVVYVRVGASGGDGTSPASAYGSLRDLSISGLPAGTVIALSRGTHQGPVRLEGGVSLWGACAAETVLTTTDPSESQGVVTLAGAGGELHDLALADSPRPGLWLSGAGVRGTVEGVVVSNTQTAGVVTLSGAGLTAHALVVRDTRSRGSDGGLGRGVVVARGATGRLSRAVIERNRDIGLFISAAGTSVTAGDLVIRDNLSRDSDGNGGRGLSVVDGATLSLSRAVIAHNHDVGLMVSGDRTDVTATDLVVRDGSNRVSDGVGGDGVFVQNGANAALSRTLVENNQEGGVFAVGAGTTASLHDLVIRDTQSLSQDGSFGCGLVVRSGATADVARAVLERNHYLAVSVDTPGTAVTLRDVVVRDTGGRASDGAFGRGLNLQDGATADLAGAVFERNHDLGIFAGGAGTSIRVTDVVVRDTRSRTSSGAGGRGMSVQRGATAELARGLFERNRDLGLFTTNPGTQATISDVVVRDTQSRTDDRTGGRGLSVQDGATTALARGLFERNRDIGVFTSGSDTSLTLNDVVVRGTHSRDADGAGGRGLEAQHGVTVEVSHGLFEGNREFGVYAADAGTSVTLLDARVGDTVAQDCASTTCIGEAAGHGVVSFRGAALSMRRFLIDHSDICGVLIARDGQLDLTRGEVSHNLIGACLQVDGYDVGRITQAVRFADNETNLQATSLPVPEPADPNL